MESEAVYTHHYNLTAGESNASGRMPVTLLMERVIEVATEHANALGIGYSTLIEKGCGWVLSRVSIEMSRYPSINEDYSVTTWIESYNRRFSERNFVIRGGGGETLGYARTIWVAMDFRTRTVADLSVFERDSFPTASLECPIERTPRIPALSDSADSENYIFRYCDIDFNRHVNTVRYLALILNHWSIGHYDGNIVGRLDLLFHHECHYGEEVTLRTDTDGEISHCEIVHSGTRALAASICWKQLS